MAALLAVCGLLIVGVVVLFAGGPVQTLAEAGSGRMAIVPPAEPIAANCGVAAGIADNACNVKVQEYDSLSMVLMYAGIGLLLLVAVSFIVFAIGCVTLH